MGISVRHDPIKSIQKLSELSGKAEQAEREAARAQQMAMRAQELEQQKELAQFQTNMKMQAQQMAMQWEMQKMQIRSMKDFEREEARLDALASRELAKEIKLNDEFELLQKQIRESDALTPEEKERALIEASSKKLGINLNTISKQGAADPMQLAIQQLMGGAQEGMAQTRGTPPEMSTDVSMGVSPEQLQSEQAGRIEVVSPDGVVGTVSQNEWPEYKAKGYQLNIFSTKQFETAEASLKGDMPISAQLALGKLIEDYPVAFKRYMAETGQRVIGERG